MRGEYCIGGATFLSFLSLILLIFAEVGQVRPSSVPKSVYMAKVNVAAYGAGLQGATNTSVGTLYDDIASDPLGNSTGLRQEYRWGLNGACAYVKNGAGSCNSTQFAIGFKPLPVILSDTPINYKQQTSDIIPTSTFKDTAFNYRATKAANFFVFFGTLATFGAFLIGIVQHRIAFFCATVLSTFSAITLLIGSAVWTAVINKNAWLSVVHVEGGTSLGIYVTRGPGLYLIWTSFVFIALSIFPYAISFFSFHPDDRNKRYR